MIKRLRWQFVGAIMLLMTILLSIVLCAIYYTTRSHMISETSLALENSALMLEYREKEEKPQDAAPPSRPDNAKTSDQDTRPEPASSHEVNAETMHQHPCFILSTSPKGELEVVGHSYYDLSDTEKLQAILEEAQAAGEDSGILRNRSLHYLKIEIRGQTKYAFADIAAQSDTLRTLRITCCLIFLATMVVFFLVSWWFSRMLVRPVDQAWRQQRQFIADASHELKTPLTVILTNAQVLQSRAIDPADNQRLVDGIVTTATQMRGLTNGLLELAKSDVKKIPQDQLPPLNLSELVENAVMCFEPTYFEAGRLLTSTVQPDIYVRGSSQHLQQVVDILLDNGRKYSTPGSAVELSLKQARGHCTLQVQSKGKTLSGQQCRDIFKRFYRVDEARSRDGSYGLGLPIAQVLVQEHHGRIWAQGKDGVNSFFVTLNICDGKKTEK